jgi:hypothetical protein
LGEPHPGLVAGRAQVLIKSPVWTRITIHPVLVAVQGLIGRTHPGQKAVLEQALIVNLNLMSVKAVFLLVERKSDNLHALV